jgi:hypothetical protein
MEWRSANIWRVITKPEYIFEVEELRNERGDQMIFIHLSVFEWTKSVLKQLMVEFRAFRAQQDVPLYATSPIADEKWQSFVKLFGFKPLVDNGEYRIFISRKDNKNNGQLRNSEDHPAADLDQRPLETAVGLPAAGV